MNKSDYQTAPARTNLSQIPASFEPRDYSRARFGADLGDADLPLREPVAPEGEFAG